MSEALASLHHICIISKCYKSWPAFWQRYSPETRSERPIRHEKCITWWKLETLIQCNLHTLAVRESILNATRTDIVPALEILSWWDCMFVPDSVPTYHDPRWGSFDCMWTVNMSFRKDLSLSSKYHFCFIINTSEALHAILNGTFRIDF